jgi:Zn-dependent alcohol dehydrogenase
MRPLQNWSSILLLNFAENIAGATDVYEDIGGPEQGQFYGQSSFSSLSIVKEASVINVKGLIKNDNELKLFAPLGCGLQTGAGAVKILGHATATDVVVVTGLGGVGLGCAMAAKVAGCRMVIGVDKVESRLDLAKSLGATGVIIRDISADTASFATDLLKMTKCERVSLVIDTTGDPSVMTAGIASLGKRGKYIQVRVPPAHFNMAISMSHFFHNSNILMGCIMGDAVPKEFIPQMIRWYRDGKFPLEKLITFMPVKDFSKALAGVQSGDLIKPVLVW